MNEERSSLRKESKEKVKSHIPITLMKVLECINILAMITSACILFAYQELWKTFGQFIFVISAFIPVFALLSICVMCYYHEMVSLSHNMLKINF